MENIKTYDFKNVLEVAKVASSNITNYLKSFPETVTVLNVEEDSRYQKKDVDLIWIVEIKGESRKLTIEIKGDRYDSGNLFFETKSNIEYDTEGCFMYTKADYIFYYFINENKVYMLPTKETREFFLENKKRFRKKYTSTNIGLDSYTSEGYVVPRWYLENKLNIKPIELR